MLYAEIDKNGRCFHVTTTKLPISETIIPMADEMGMSVLGKIWNGSSWDKPEPIPEPDPPLTEQEQIAIDTALNVEYMACLMEANLG